MALVIQVKRGDRGDAVKGVQQEFQFRNGSGDPNQGLQIDGSFGPGGAVFAGGGGLLGQHHACRVSDRGSRSDGEAK